MSDYRLHQTIKNRLSVLISRLSRDYKIDELDLHQLKNLYVNILADLKIELAEISSLCKQSYVKESIGLERKEKKK